MMSMTWGAATDVGSIRVINEDSHVASPPVFLVADGMGGAAAGEVASGIVVEEFARLAEQTPVTAASVRLALSRANAAILDSVEEDGSRRGMGTTAVGLIKVTESGQECWLLFNVGDSRLYRCRGTELELLTVDHSEVQELIEAGLVTEAERQTHPRTNVITRALGMDPPSMVDYWLRGPVAGETFLLCSDGLTRELSDEVLLAHLSTSEPPPAVATRLVDNAVRAGGRDNITAIVVHVVSADYSTVDSKTVEIPALDMPTGELVRGPEDL
jgi:protein phosphatase